MISYFKKYLIILSILIYWLICFLIGLYLFFFQKVTFDKLNTIAIIFLVVILLLIFLGEIFVHKIKKSELNLKKNKKLIKSLKDLSNKHYKIYYQQVLLHINISNIIYYLIISLLVISLGVCAISFFQLSMLFSFLVAIILFYSLKPLVFKEDNKFEVPNILDKEQNEELYELLNEIKSEYNYQKEIVLFLSLECNAGAIENDGKCYIELGYELLNLLTKEELKAVISHEIVHLINEDSKVYNKMSKDLKKWKDIQLAEKNSLVASLIFAPISYLLLNDYYLFSSLSSEYLEFKADSYVHDKENLRSALIKIKISEIIDNESKYTIIRDSLLFKSKDNFSNYFEVNYNLTKDIYNKYKKEITDLLYLPLKLDFDSHPLLKERIKALGLEEMEVSFEDYNLKYPAAHKLAKGFLKGLEADFNNEVEYFLECNKKVDNFEKRVNDYGFEELLNLGMIYEDSLANDKKAEDLYDKVIRESDKINKRAYFLKGKILLKNNDPIGESYIYQIMRLDPYLYLEDGYEYLINYYILHGKEKEYEKLVAYESEIETFVNEELTKIKLGKNDKVYFTIRRKEDIEDYLNIVRKYQGAKRVYIFDKEMEKGNLRSVFLIDIEDEEIFNNIQKEMYNYDSDCNLYVVKYQRGYKRYCKEKYRVL